MIIIYDERIMMTGTGTRTWDQDGTGTWDRDRTGTWDRDGTRTWDRDMGPGIGFCNWISQLAFAIGFRNRQIYFSQFSYPRAARVSWALWFPLAFRLREPESP